VFLHLCEVVGSVVGDGLVGQAEWQRLQEAKHGHVVLRAVDLLTQLVDDRIGHICDSLREQNTRHYSPQKLSKDQNGTNIDRNTLW
jgi:hypothetical protein